MSAARRTFLSPGERAEFSKAIIADDVSMFSKISGDDDPVHVDADYAAKTAFGWCIAHGALMLGLSSTTASIMSHRSIARGAAGTLGSENRRAISWNRQHRGLPAMGGTSTMLARACNLSPENTGRRIGTASIRLLRQAQRLRMLILVGGFLAGVYRAGNNPQGLTVRPPFDAPGTGLRRGEVT